MNVTLTLHDLGLIIVFVLVVVAVIYFIITMRRVYNLLGHVQQTLQTNEANLNKTLSTLPKVLARADDIAVNVQSGARVFGTTVPVILHNISAVSGSLKDSTDVVVQYVDVIGAGITETVDTVKESSADVIDYIKIIVEAVRYIVQCFSSR